MSRNIEKRRSLTGDSGSLCLCSNGRRPSFRRHPSTSCFVGRRFRRRAGRLRRYTSDGRCLRRP